MPFAPARPLLKGDRVAVVAPSGPFDRAAFDQGLAVLSTQFTPVFSERIFHQQRYLAGPDSERGADLQRALDDEGLRAVFAARGGYGAHRLLASLRGVARKPLVGFSDTTALHALVQREGGRSVHGPVLTQLGRQPREVLTRFFDLLQGRPLSPLHGTYSLVPGVAEGPLLGGNLSVLAALAGTPFLPDLRGAVLLLEDVGERPYRLDRLWTQLRLAGLLSDLAGVALGEFTGCEETGAGYSCLDVLRTLAEETGVPCVAGFQIGHGGHNHPVVLGARVRLVAPLTGEPGSLSFLEGLTC